jgi:hypothetical protein
LPKSLVLEYSFRITSSWNLFLGLVGLFKLCDLGKLMWEPLVVILGLSRFSVREIFIGAHSLPLLGRLSVLQIRYRIEVGL